MSNEKLSHSCIKEENNANSRISSDYCKICLEVPYDRDRSTDIYSLHQSSNPTCSKWHIQSHIDSHLFLMAP